MSTSEAETRAEAATIQMQRHRADLRSMFGVIGQGAQRTDEFPRSATLRWILGHLSPRAIAWTALTTALTRIPFGPLINGVLSGRRR